MAITATSQGSTNATTAAPSRAISCAEGDVIIAFLGTRFSTQALDTIPSDYTLGDSDETSTVSNTYWWYKVAEGTETAVSCTTTTSNNCTIGAIVLSGFSGATTATLEDSKKDITQVATVSSSGGFGGSGSLTSSTGMAVGILFADVGFSPAASVTGYTLTLNAGAVNGGFQIFTKALSVPTSENPSWSTSDSDENTSYLAIFGDAVASGGTTVDVPAGNLTLTGYAPTVVTTANKTIAVPKGALILTGYAPTVIGSTITSTQKGGFSWTESDYRIRERLRKQALQQAYLADDEEALAILLASIMRN